MRWLACVALALALPAAAQTPDTDIYVGRIVRADGGIRIEALANITARAGYDNQPHFTPDGAVLYTRAEGGQTDIWRWDPGRGAGSALTHTAESEYSPTPIAGGGFAVIRVEADSTQRLWRFEADGTGEALLFPDVKPVGYQAWLDDSTAALFILGTPASLQTARLGRPGTRLVAADIGRAIQKVPGSRRASFVQQRDGGTWIVIHDPAAAPPLQPLVRVPVDTVVGEDGARREVPGEYHAWLPDGLLLATAGAKIFALEPGSTDWRLVADHAAAGWRLSRIAVDARGERIALVIEAR